MLSLLAELLKGSTKTAVFKAISFIVCAFSYAYHFLGTFLMKEIISRRNFIIKSNCVKVDLIFLQLFSYLLMPLLLFFF